MAELIGGLIAISATFVPSLTAIAMWPNDNIKSQCTGKAWVGLEKDDAKLRLL